MSEERMYPETIEKARQWIDELRDSLHRERAYIQRLEHDVSIQRDAIDTVLAQGGLAKTTMRRILRLAAAGCTFSIHRPHELKPLPDFRLEQITALQLRQKSWVR